MKKLYSIFTLLLIHFYCFSQVSFQSGFGDTARDYGRVIIPTSLGEYCIVGPTGINTPDSADIAVFFVDNTGALVHTFKIGFTGDDFPTGVAETSDGGYIIVGTTHASPFDTAHSDIFAFKLSYPGGFVIWSKVYGGSDDDEANSIIKTKDDNFIILGSTKSYGTATTQSALALKISDTGDQQWCNVSNASQSDYFSTGYLTPDHKYILGGGSFNGASTDNFVVKMDTAGMISWSKRFGTSSDDWINDLKVTTDNFIIATGNSTSNTAGNNDASILKIDTAGTLIWNYNYGNTGFDRSSSIIETSSNHYLICGYTTISTSGNDINQLLLSEIDNTGAIFWTSIYGDSVQASEGYCVISGLDGGYAATGFSVAFGEPNGDVDLVKTDYDGISGCYEFNFNYVRTSSTLTVSSGITQQQISINEDSVFMNRSLFYDQYSQNCFFVNAGSLPLNNALQLYPNPTSGILHLESELRNGTVSVYDQLGRSVYRQKISSSKSTLDLQTLPTGIYLLEIKSENDRILKRFIRD